MMRTPRHLRLLAPLAMLALAACGDDATPVDATADAGADATSDAGVDTGADAGVDVGTDADAGSIDVAPDVPPPPPQWCDGATAHRWEPFTGDDLDMFPDGMLTRDDPTSPTGQRLEVTVETAPWLDNTADLLRGSVESLNQLSGFGTMGGVLLRFEQPVNTVPSGAEASTTDPGWQWLDLGHDPPVRVPFESVIFEDGLTVVLWPLRPLALATPHAIVVTTDALADDGDCIAPAPTTRDLLYGEPDNERVARFAPVYRDALDQIGLAPDQVSVLSVYTTHDDLGAVRRTAELVHDAPVEWTGFGGCTARAVLLLCAATTPVLDYPKALGVVDDTVTPREGTIPVTYWVPRDATGPLPVIVYGHGLNSRRTEGYEIAQRVAQDGVIVVAMEAVEHGDHPQIDPSEGGEDALRFLGVDLVGLQLDAPRIRGNFNQTNIDRLRLIRLLRTHPDLDGDGVDDIDPERVTYIGASLGALCGVGLLALSPDLDAAVLTIGGARLMSIVTETDMLRDFEALIAALVGSQEVFDRLMPVAQHVVDAADPGTWAAHVLRDRFDGRTPPNLLVAVGTDDDVVPPAAGRALARALDLPHVRPVAMPVELIDVVDAPLSGNLADGTRTAGYFQFDRVTRGGQVRPARHTDTAKCDESALQIRRFLQPWGDGEVPVIIDPYPELGTPPLEP